MNAIPYFNTVDNRSFATTLPSCQIAFDTKSLESAKTCPRLYFLEIVEGWRPKEPSVHLIFGLGAHHAIETYHHARADGKSHREGMRAAVRVALNAHGQYRDFYRCDDCGAERLQSATAMKLCLTCNSENLTPFKKFLPWKSDHPNKNRPNLIRTIVWYLDFYENSVEKTVIMPDGKPGVELWFRLELPILTPDGKPYILTGHLDRLVDLAGAFWFQDLKTTKNTIDQAFFDKYKPDNQMYFYTVAGKIVLKKEIRGGVIDAAQVAVKFTRFRRGFIELTPLQVEEWLRDAQYWIKQMEDCAKNNYWPMNDTACHQYGRCDFKGLCGKDPTARKMYLKKGFKQVHWDPLKPRN